MNSPLRVLVEAYACEPGSGSEPGIGWNWALQAARHGHEVTIITRANNRTAIESGLAETPVANLRFHYVDLSRPFLDLKRRFGYFGLNAYYYFWQIRVAVIARKLHAECPFDLVHHVTFCNDWMPSGLALVDAPFIWGPVGGSTHLMPEEMKRSLPRSFRRYESSRQLFQTTLSRFDPWVALTRHRAALILTYSKEALAGVPLRHRGKARSIVHVGVRDSDILGARDAMPPATPFTVVSGGRLVHWKGFDLLVEGFARFVRGSGADARLVLTGDGPYRGVLERYVRLHSLEDRVRFLGRLPSREDVYEVLATGHLYALPTLRDGPPVAIVEAMLAAKPVLCLDLGATRELVPTCAGLKIAQGSREEMTESIATALAWGHDHIAELHAMGQRARDHVLAVHEWGRIGDEVEQIYQRIQARR